MIHLSRRATLAAMLALPLASAFGQSYPSQATQLVVPFAPGGLADVTARLVAQQLAPRLGQPVIVENRTGAAGTIAASYVSTAKPDGYTLVMVAASHSSSKALYPWITYDPVTSFASVAGIASFPVVVVVKEDSKYNSLADLVEDIKARSGQLNNANPGPSTVPGLSAELFKQRFNLDFLSVAYKGSSPALMAVMSSETEFAFSEAGTALAQIKAGRLKALAVLQKERLAELPDVPSIDETEMAGVHTSAWLGVLAPKGTPQSIVERLNKEIGVILESSQVKERIAAMGGVSMFGPPEDFNNYLMHETERWTPIIQSLDLKAQ